MTLFDTKGGATVQDTSAENGASGEDRINSLLSQDSGGDSEATPGGDTPVGGSESGAERDGADERVAGAETEEAEEATEEGTGETAGEDEGEFELTEQDADYSDAAYRRAAEHYSKTFGKQLDPNDAGDKALLRELMQRGERIRQLQATDEEEPEETEEAAESETAEAKPPEKPTVEQIKGFVQRAREQAKANIVPEVAMDFANSFMAAMWPGKKIEISQEQANALAETFSTFAIMQIADAIPSIIGVVPQAVQRDPMFARVRETAVKESALDELLEATSKDGREAFPGLEGYVENGSIRRMLNSDELKNAEFNKDPYKNFVAKLKMAYRLVRNQGVDVATIERANRRGREAAEERQRRVAAGRTPPGSASGGPGGKAGGNFINSLVNGSGSKFGRALAEARK